MNLNTRKVKYDEHEYTIVTVNMNAFDTTKNMAIWAAIEQWCDRMFGPRASEYQQDPLTEPGRWYYSGRDRDIWFSDPIDAALFVLRWS
jgi:hypothetical protein